MDLEFVKLSNLNTPIHRWNLTDLPDGFEVFIKRDDLTGSELSGSKGVKHVVTGGGHQSGFCRTVSLICCSLGLEPHMVIGGVHKRDNLSSQGNALLYRMAGSKIYLPPKGTYERFIRRISEAADYISDKYGEDCYYIPVGGSSIIGVYGYFHLFEELLRQGLHERFDDIVISVGTGGTTIGLAVANYLTGSKIRVHAVTVGQSKEAHFKHMDTYLEDMGLDTVKSEDLVDIIEGYIGEHYAASSMEVLRLITKVSSTTGILLDPYYTGKGVMGMVTEMATNPSRFKGKRILFIHTGGSFGLFSGEMDRIVDKEGEVTSDIVDWPVGDERSVNR